MRAPDFWYREPRGRDSAPMIRALLTPAAWLYDAVGRRRRARVAPEAVGVPVVCVGNVTMGGAGKTPVARAIRAALGGAEAGAHTLSRGYGGREKGPHLVSDADDASRVGDEPLLHAKDGPAWVAVDRIAGARAAVAAGAKAIVMDDGFQNPALAKDLSILVFDAGAGVGNGRLFPVGPLRERLTHAFARADAAVLMGAEPGAAPAYLDGFAGPVLRARLAPLDPPPPGPLLAFAGIARPTKFFDTVTAAGGALIDGASFPDHHPFRPAELTRLEAHAAAHEASLVTTEKDAMRLPPDWRARVAVIRVAAAFEDADALARVLAPVATRLEKV